MRALAVLAVTLFATSGCSKSSPEGLPPATEWQTGDPALAQGSPAMGGGSPHAMGGAANDPHAGMFGNSGGGAAADPHAGVPGAPPLPPGQFNDPNNPHGGVGAAVDVTQLGLSSPDPSRPIDPNRHIRGSLALADAVKARVKPGTAVFLMVRKQGSDGKPTGAPIAVDKVTWTEEGQKFELTEKNAMVAGAPDLVGDLVVMARIDQDSDAMTRQPGDVTGETRIKIPAEGVVLKLDTVLQ
jgi:hypothetical protein